MRILLVSHSSNNPNAGASRVYHLLTEGLRQRGHSVTCLHLEDLHLPKRLGRPAKKLWLPRYAADAARKAHPDNFDVIMCSNGMLHRLYAELSKRSERPLLVQHYHGLTLFDRQAILTEALRGHIHPSLLYRKVTGRLPGVWDELGARYSDLAIVQNDRDADALEEKTTKPVVRIPLALHPAIAEAGERLDPQKPRRPQSLVWFGSWSERKGCFYLPPALRRLAQSFPDLSLTIGGTDRGDSLKSYFDPALRDRITVLGHISIDQQIELFASNSIFVFPSISEGFGFALLEAMALGMACVTTDTGLGGDSLHDREDALIVPVASSLHLSQALAELLRNGELRGHLALRARAKAQEFTPERMISSYEQAFQEGLHSLRKEK